MIRVAIVEDISRIAETLKQKILLSPDFCIVNMASNGKEIIHLLQKDHALDVIIMDINMPENIKIIMSTVFDDEQNLFNAIMAGANGYLLKDETPQKIHRSIYEALEGGAPMSQIIARKALALIKTGKPESSKTVKVDYGLSEREQEVLEHLSKGLSYEQIADNLFISYGTVRKHVENIYRKLRVNNRTEAIDKANKGNLL